jgi:hypothetical protein
MFFSSQSRCLTSFNIDVGYRASGRGSHNRIVLLRSNFCLPSQVRPTTSPSTFAIIGRTLPRLFHLTLYRWILHVNDDVSPPSYYTKLSMAPQSDQLDPIYDDMTIAEGLLNNTKVPRRSSSFTGSQNLVRSTGQFRSSVALADASVVAHPRRAVRTSNTWTSSEGDVLSDQDEVDDRAVFIHEFNRLARKVFINRC